MRTERKHHEAVVVTPPTKPREAEIEERIAYADLDERTSYSGENRLSDGISYTSLKCRPLNAVKFHGN